MRIIEKLARHHEPDLIKSIYLEYLEKNKIHLSGSLGYAPYLLSLLNDTTYQPTVPDLNNAVYVARWFCDFGLQCNLFDDQIYLSAISSSDIDTNDILAVFKLYFRVYQQTEEKAQTGSLTVMDVKQAAAIRYHLQTLKWITMGIFPFIHSPYRSH